MSNEQKSGKRFEIPVSGNIPGGKGEAEGDIIAIATPASANYAPVQMGYKESTSSREIVQKTIAANNVPLTPDQFEIVTETIERSKGLGSGFKCAFEFFGIGKFEFQKKPAKETKTTMKAKYGDSYKK